MAVEPLLSEQRLDSLRGLHTCGASNAIEVLGVRLRNTGFAGASIGCVFEGLGPMLGYSVIARLGSRPL